MQIPTIPNTSVLIEELEKSYQAVYDYIEELDDNGYQQGGQGKWSPMQHLEHLILSSKMVPTVLNFSKIKFLPFGKSKNGSRSYEALFNSYKEALSAGQKAPSKYSPDLNTLYPKKEQLSNWMLISGKFRARIEKWSEKDLDQYRIKHPALGKLTIREFLLFTILHTYHHLKGMQN